METTAMPLAAFKATLSQWIGLTGEVVDLFGVVVILLGFIWSGGIFLHGIAGERRYDQYRIQIGRSLILGLEILVAADIIKTIALEPDFRNLGVLAALVLIRTFLNWTLVSELDRIGPTTNGSARPKS